MGRERGTWRGSTRHHSNPSHNMRPFAPAPRLHHRSPQRKIAAGQGSATAAKGVSGSAHGGGRAPHLTTGRPSWRGPRGGRQACGQTPPQATRARRAEAGLHTAREYMRTCARGGRARVKGSRGAPKAPSESAGHPTRASRCLPTYGAGDGAGRAGAAAGRAGALRPAQSQTWVRKYTQHNGGQGAWGGHHGDRTRGDGALAPSPQRAGEPNWGSLRRRAGAANVPEDGEEPRALHHIRTQRNKSNGT
jgi:hypothetical protein